ncbi:MAG: 2'-5' RNA ligase family protein [Anaerolineae bacterium]
MDTPLTRSRYALVARLPRPVEVQIEDAFLTLVGITRPIMGFHITLVGPFTWIAESPPQGVLDRLARLCLRVQPIELQIGGQGAFVGIESNAVYLKVVRNDPLCRLQAQADHLLRPHIVLQRDIISAEYVPHVTLGLGLTPDERDRALATLADAGFSATVPVNELHLVEERPGSPWRPLLALPLAGQPSPEPHRIHEE